MERLMLQSEKQALSDISVAYERYGIGVRNSVQDVLLEFHGRQREGDLISMQKESLPEDIWQALWEARYMDAVEEVDRDSVIVDVTVLEALIDLMLGMLEALLKEDSEYFGPTPKRQVRYPGGGHELVPWLPER